MGRVLNRLRDLELGLADTMGRVDDLEEEQTLPAGAIIMWSGKVDSNGHPIIGSTPDLDWWLCNGEHGTPDLTDRFVIGAGGEYVIGNTGGSAEQTLEVANMPEHGHSFSATTSDEGGHQHFMPVLYVTRYDDVTPYLLDAYNPVREIGYEHNNWSSTRSSAEGEHSHTVSGTTGEVGDSEAFDIMPPYYALAYIMYLPGE